MLNSAVDSPPAAGVAFPCTPICPPKPTSKVCLFSTAAFRSRGLGTTPRIPTPSLPEGVACVTDAAAASDAPWFGVHTRIDLRGSRDAATAWGLYLAGLPFYYPQ